MLNCIALYFSQPFDTTEALGFGYEAGFWETLILRWKYSLYCIMTSPQIVPFFVGIYLLTHDLLKKTMNK